MYITEQILETVILIYMGMLLHAIWYLVMQGHKSLKIKVLMAVCVTVIPVLGLLIFYGGLFINILIEQEQKLS